MPRIGEIFSEGMEHARRSLRQFNFEQQLKTAERMEKRTLQAIGEAAWRLRLEEGADSDAWQELDRLEREIVLIHEETAKRTEQLRTQMAEERKKHLELETTGGIADVDLEELAAKRTSLSLEIEKQERSVKDAEDDEKKLKTAKEKLSAARTALSDVNAQIEEVQETLNRAAANQQKMLQRTEYLERQERATHEEMIKREKDTRKSAAPHYRALGRYLLDNRPDHAELAPLFAKYDLVTTTAETTRHNIDSERRLVELLDQTSVIWFYGLCIGGVFASIAILVLLLLWIVPALW